MFSSGIIFSHVNILGGYSWVTINGSELNSELTETLNNFINKPANTRNGDVIEGSLSNNQQFIAYLIFDKDGKDEIGRTDLVFIIGAIGSADLVLSKPTHDELTQLLKTRQEIVDSTTSNVIARLAFCGALNQIVKDPETVTTSSEIIEEEVSLSKKEIKLLRFMVSLALISSVVALGISTINLMKLEIYQKNSHSPLRTR